MIVTRITVEPGGGILDCRVEASGDLATMPNEVKSGPCPGNGGYAQGYRDTQGNPVTRLVIMTQKVEVLPVGQTASFPVRAKSR